MCRQTRRGRRGEEGREEQERGSREEKVEQEERVRREKELLFQNVSVHRKEQMYVPTQVLWSLPSWNPVRESHVHWKEPAVLTQLPRGSQPSLPITHSFMSEGKETTL